MGRGWGGVRYAQRCLDGRPDSVWIAEHLMIPKADHAISLTLDNSGAPNVERVAMLAAIDFNPELRTVADKIYDEVSDRRLSAKMVLGKAFAQQTPELSFGVSGAVSQPPSATDRT